MFIMCLIVNVQNILKTNMEYSCGKLFKHEVVITGMLVENVETLILFV